MLANRQDLFPITWVRRDRGRGLKVGPAGCCMAERTVGAEGASFGFEVVFAYLVVYRDRIRLSEDDDRKASRFSSNSPASNL
jgi:hypothetical protein